MSSGKVYNKWWYTTEPFLLFYITALMLHNPIFQQFVYSRVSEKYHYPYTYNQQKSCDAAVISNQTNETSLITDKIGDVQADSAAIETGFVMFNTLPAAVVCLFLGSLSDRYGRKPILLMSLAGAFLQGTLILLVMFFNLPIWVLFIAGACNGSGGYLAGLLMATFAYIADVTPPEKRGIRLAYVEGIVFLGGTFASSGSGHLITALGFQKSYAIVTGLFFSALLYVFFVLPESLPPAIREAKRHGSTESCCCSPIVKLYRVITRPRPEKWKLKCLIPATMFMNMLTLGLNSTTMLFLLNRPLCLSAIHVGYAVGAKFLSVGVGAAVGLKFLSRCFPDYVLMVVGFFSHIGSLALLAFASREWIVFLSAAVALAVGYPAPLFRSNLSKAVDADEQGAIFSFSTTMEMLFSFIGTLIFNAFYMYCVKQLKFGGAVFLLACLIALIPLFLAVLYGVVSFLYPADNQLISIIESDEGSVQSIKRQLLQTGRITSDYGSRTNSPVCT